MITSSFAKINLLNENGMKIKDAVFHGADLLLFTIHPGFFSCEQSSLRNTENDKRRAIILIKNAKINYAFTLSAIGICTDMKILDPSNTQFYSLLCSSELLWINNKEDGSSVMIFARASKTYLEFFEINLRFDGVSVIWESSESALESYNTLVNQTKGERQRVTSMNKLFSNEFDFTLDDKSVVKMIPQCFWEKAAEKYAEIGHPNVKKQVRGLLYWLQDLNWPGATTIFNLLKEVPNEVLVNDIERALSDAIDTNDGVWIYWMYELISQKKLNSEMKQYICSLTRNRIVCFIKALLIEASDMKANSIEEMKKVAGLMEYERDNECLNWLFDIIEQAGLTQKDFEKI